jgi:outer membrane protein
VKPRRHPWRGDRPVDRAPDPAADRRRAASISSTDNRSVSFGTSPDPEDPGGTVFGETESSSGNTNRSVGLSLTQSIYDHGNWTRLRAVRVRVDQADVEYEAVADQLMVRGAASGRETLVERR